MIREQTKGPQNPRPDRIWRIDFVVSMRDCGLVGIQGIPVCLSPLKGRSRMKAKSTSELRDGAQCKVIGGTHKGKLGTVRDINTSKTGHVTITVVEPNGERFKTLAKNVVVEN